MGSVEKNVSGLTETIAGLSKGGKPAKIIAVSKGQDAKKILEAYDAGVRNFGENRIQEAVEKIPLLPKNATWHLVGHLQTNKAKKAVKLFHMIHSVDSEKLASELDKFAEKEGKKQKILLQVNISEEESKFGMKPEETAEIAKKILQMKNIELIGLMTIAPDTEDRERIRGCFAGLRKLKEEIEKETPVSLPELSMGMSSDYEIAIEEGATMLRIGRTIFK